MDGRVPSWSAAASIPGLAGRASSDAWARAGSPGELPATLGPGSGERAGCVGEGFDALDRSVGKATVTQIEDMSPSR